MNPTDNLYRALKDGLIPFTGSHDIHTPRELVEDILGRIQLDGTVLVLFNVEFVVSLVYTYNVDPEKITFYSDHDNKNKICDRLGVKYITSLETDMKFDVVVGNPPYQNGKDQYFYKKFAEKAFDLSSGVVAMITSANWVSGTGKSKKFFRQIIDKKITHYKYLGGKAFDVQILTAYFICQPKTNVETLEIISEDKVSVIPRIDFSKVSSGKTDALTIIKKLTEVAKNNFVNFQSGELSRSKARVSSSGFKAIFGCGKINEDFDWKFVKTSQGLAGLDQHKVVFSKNSSLGQIGAIKYANPSFGCAANAYFITTIDKATANNIIAYLNSKLIKTVIKNLKHASCTNSKGLINQIPLIDFRRSWTDQELYTHFNLTDEEIAYIEANS